MLGVGGVKEVPDNSCPECQKVMDGEKVRKL